MYDLESLKLSSTVRWVQNGITVAGAGAANGESGSSFNRLSRYTGIYCADDDILYIADPSNNRIVLIASNSTTAMALMGQQSQSDTFTFSSPYDVFVTRTSIYVMDTGNFRVQKWSRDLSNATTAAGFLRQPGDSTNMKTFSFAYNLFVDNYDSVFVSDYGNHRVIRFPWNSMSDTNGAMVAGTGIRGSQSNQLNQPRGIFVTDNEMLYIADLYNHRIQKWTIGNTNGVTVAGTGMSGRALSQLSYPNAVLVDLNGDMYITDSGNDRIVRWGSGTDTGECIAGCTGYWGIDSSQLSDPNSIAFDSSGSMYVSDTRNNRVQKFELLTETSRVLI